MYTLDPTTGILASIGPPVAAADFWSRSVTVDPTGKFAYVANGGGDEPAATFNGSVAMYTINAVSGALTLAGTILAPCAPSPGSCAPISVAVHPSGKFAYVANEGGFAPTSVSMYSINATTGALGFIGVIATAGRAISVAVDPSGRFAYVTNSDEISMYTINASSGTLTSTGTIPEGGSAVAVHPSSNFAYVLTGSNISMYTINTDTGALTSIGTIAAGLSPTSIAIHPSGKFAYVTNYDSHNVSMYSIDAATGALTLIGTIGT